MSGMLRGKRFSKKMSEQRWSAFDAILEHKAWKAGVRFSPAASCSECVEVARSSESPVVICRTTRPLFPVGGAASDAEVHYRVHPMCAQA